MFCKLFGYLFITSFYCVNVDLDLNLDPGLDSERKLELENKINLQHELEYDLALAALDTLDTLDTGADSGFLSGDGRDFFRGWRKSPRGWRRNFALPTPPSRFCFPTQHY